MLGAVAIFVYVGGEVAIGSFLVNFLGMPNIGGLSAERAGYYLSFYWGGAMVGRFIGAVVMRYVKPGQGAGVQRRGCRAAGPDRHGVRRATSRCGRSSPSGCSTRSCSRPSSRWRSRASAGTPARAPGILCMAIVGGAIVPVVQGVFADTIGIQMAFFLPILCYAYIAYYGAKGHVPSYGRTAS